MSKMSEIKLLSEGHQVKKAILQSFGSIEQFADKVNMYPESVKRYLRSRAINSATFKIKLTQAIGKGYDQIVLTDEEQIRAHIIELAKVSVFEDGSIMAKLDSLRRLCLKNSMIREKAILYRIYAKYYGQAGSNELSLEFMKLAIATALDIGESDMIIQLKVELAYMYICCKNYTDAQTCFTSVSNYFQGIGAESPSRELSYSYFFWYGILSLTLKDFEGGRDLLIKALELAPNSTEKGNAIMNIGNSYKEQSDFPNAMSYYQKSLCEFGNNNTESYIVIYNIAELYWLQGKYKDAADTIEIALNYFEDKYVEGIFSVLQVYIKIHEDIGQYETVVHKLLSVVKKAKLYKQNDKYLTSAIHELLRIIKKYAYNTVIDELEQLLVCMIKSNTMETPELEKELKACLGDLYMYRLSS